MLRSRKPILRWEKAAARFLRPDNRGSLCVECFFFNLLSLREANFLLVSSQRCGESSLTGCPPAIS